MSSTVSQPVELQGIAVSRGIAIGRALVLNVEIPQAEHYLVEPKAVPQELARLEAALQVAIQELQQLHNSLNAAEASSELGALLDVHLMVLQDPSFLESVSDWVKRRFFNAEWALLKHLETLTHEFEGMEDAYLRERLADMEQLVARVQRNLRQQAAPSASTGFDSALERQHAKLGEAGHIVVARDLSPADMLQFRRQFFAGFVTEVGGTTSHTAIVARSMDIPAVVGAKHACQRIKQGDCVVVLAETGQVIINPSEQELAHYQALQKQASGVVQRQKRLLHTPALTQDGEAIELLANIELPEDAQAALDAGAAGVGLFRSEFLFMGRDNQPLPGEEEQYQAYRRVVEAMQGLPVTIRTIDVGADKQLGQAGLFLEQQSALGLRAIRWSLSEPEMFGAQLRAILRAAQHGPVHILIPMLGQLVELTQVQQHLDLARQNLQAANIPFGQVQLGAMIEVPAAALMIDQFLNVFDFVSIGTNDLTQYTLAIDRADESVAHLFDPLHPAVLRLIAHVIERSRARGKGVSVCGEMAGDAKLTHLLLGMGLRSFSSHPAQILAVKEQLLQADTQRLKAFAAQVLASDVPREVLASYQAPEAAAAS